MISVNSSSLAFLVSENMLTWYDTRKQNTSEPLKKEVRWGAGTPLLVNEEKCMAKTKDAFLMKIAFVHMLLIPSFCQTNACMSEGHLVPLISSTEFPIKLAGISHEAQSCPYSDCPAPLACRNASAEPLPPHRGSSLNPA